MDPQPRPKIAAVIDERSLLEDGISKSRANRTIRPGRDLEFSDKDEHIYLNHHCPENLCTQDPTLLLLFIKYFDLATMMLTYVGSLHIKAEDKLSCHLSTIRQMIGPWCVNEELRFWEDVHATMVLSTDPNRTCTALDLQVGDILVVQKASDGTLYKEAYRNFAVTEEGPTVVGARKQGRSSLSDHMESLWEDQVGADIVIAYGNNQRACHRAVLSRAPYFHSLFNNGTFAKVGDTVTLPDVFPKHGVEPVLQYLYIDDPTMFLSLDSRSRLAVMRVLEFLCLTEEVRPLAAFFTLAGCSAETVVDALELAVSCSSGDMLLKCVAGYVVENFSILHEEGPFSENILADPDKYRLLMGEVGERMRNKRKK
ncbi:hypothetical protein HDV00_009641 [Rhizophlyctis rosea]|nr:hypothetical protein HDV00_009641 [Rhizophlyctis rosea]